MRTGDIWNLTKPSIPPRSYLYPLEPLGIGTPLTESLTSYVTRLAEAHCVPVDDLIHYALTPLLQRIPILYEDLPGLSSIAQLPRRQRYLIHVLFESDVLINGSGDTARCWVQVLEQLTLRTDLRFLTLLSWPTDIMSLLRKRRAWCPACYEEWRTAGQPIYDPLLWSFDGMNVCLRHLRSLWQKCPQKECLASVHWFISQDKLGYCGQCGGWLGLTSNSNAGEEKLPQADDLIEIFQISDDFGKRIAAAPSLRL